MRKKKMRRIGAEECYLALIIIEDAFMKGCLPLRNRDFKEYLADKSLYAGEKKMGINNARRIFWRLSVVNGYVKRVGENIVITEEGYKFFRADEFKRAEIFQDVKNFSDDFPKILRRYRQRAAEMIGKGYRLVRYRGNNRNREYTKAGWIYEFAHFELGDNIDSMSVAFYHAEQEGNWHEHSLTKEVFLFIAGNGYLEIGEEKKKVPVNKDWAVIIDAGVAHRVVPIVRMGKEKGKYLTAFVLAYPGWKSKNEYKIGEGKPRYDGPVE